MLPVCRPHRRSPNAGGAAIRIAPPEWKATLTRLEENLAECAATPLDGSYTGKPRNTNLEVLSQKERIF